MADSTPAQRGTWGSRIGIIMAVAGSAVGIGNFLRFPVQAARNGGGAFMIPYFVSLLLLGIPLMWVEWTIGRYGGGFGHGSAPGAFQSLWRKNRFIKYFGVIGIFGPLVIFMYYCYVESWLLGYSFYALTGKYASAANPEGMKAFLEGYQGLESNQYFSSMWPAYIFFLITFALNMIVLYRGISGGIEKVCNLALPMLAVLGIIIAVRVLFLGAPDPAKPDWSTINGLGYLWNPDFGQLTKASVWMAAAGQIFFTLSVGIGAIITYASYLSRADDVTLSGLTATSANEFAEVVLGGTIAIPACYAFFGPDAIKGIADSGAFNLGFVTMPLVFAKIPMSAVFGGCWFIMLFLAGITSSISLVQPAIAFLEDEFDIERKNAVKLFAAVSFVLCQPAIFMLSRGVMDDLDFWGGTVLLVIFATTESILFAWVFGIDKAWDEIHVAARMRLPGIYKFIIKYVTPLFLLTIIGMWLYQDWWPVIVMKNVKPADKPFVLQSRLMLLGTFLALCVMVHIAWRKRRPISAQPDVPPPVAAGEATDKKGDSQ
ncbi:MAG: sodium-dependent transporter [Planctomycetota bacterium]